MQSTIAGAEPVADAVVVEWAPFTLAAGVTEERLLAASETLQRDFLRHQPGFMRRELLRGTDGQWADLVYWSDHSSADAVMQAAMASPICHEYFHLMAGGAEMEPGTGVLHFSRVRQY